MREKLVVTLRYRLGELRKEGLGHRSLIYARCDVLQNRQSRLSVRLSGNLAVEAFGGQVLCVLPFETGRAEAVQMYPGGRAPAGD
jgi:hypothetical protein